jgi:hypothetical protein
VIVIDLGCAEQGGSDSVGMLIERFHPRVLYGFDPHTPVVTGTHRGGTRLVLSSKVAWTREGTVIFQDDGAASCVVEGEPLLHPSYRLNPAEPREVECFDLAAWIFTLPGDKIVLKMDVESAEIPLLEHLIETHADECLWLVLAEFHPGTPEDHERREWIEETFACPIQNWAH